MSIVYINTGTSANAGNGDSIRLAFTKVNENFGYIDNIIHDAFGPGGLLGDQDVNTTSSVTFANLTVTNTATLFDVTMTGTVTVGAGTISVNNSGTLIVNGTPLAVFDQDLNTFNNVKFSGLTVTNTLFQGTAYDNIEYTDTAIRVDADTDSFAQSIFQNHNSGTNASTDLVLMNDLGDDFTGIIDMGINSSNYNVAEFGVTPPGAGYLFTNGGDLAIGTQTPNTKLIFHAGGTTLADSAAVLDGYAWRFNRNVQVIVPTPGPLNFTVWNTQNNSAATAVYQAINESNGVLQMGIQSGNAGAIDGNILPGESFIHTHSAENNLHIGQYSDLNFYTDVNNGYYGTATLTMSKVDQSSNFGGNVLPKLNLTYDLGSTSSQWRNLYIDGSIYQNGSVIGSTVVSDTPPTNANTGTTWYDLISGRTYVFFDSSWVDSSPDVGFVLPVASTSTLGGVKVDGTTITIDNGVISSTPQINLSAVAQNIVPNNDSTYDLGSTSSQWRSLYVSSSTIYLGGVAIAVSGTNLTVDGQALTSPPTNVLTSGTSHLTLTEDGTVTFPPGATLFQNTASIVSILASQTLSSILEYSTTSTDALVIGQYGLTNGVAAPYTVVEFTTTPPVALLPGDVIAGAGFAVPSTIVHAGTGTYTTVVIVNSQIPELGGPIPGEPVTLARPLVQQSLTLATPANNNIVLAPGTGGHVLVNDDLIPLANGTSHLGSVNNRWKDIWIGAGTIFFQDETLGTDLAITSKDGLFTVQGAGGLDVGQFVFLDNKLTIKDLSRDIIIGQSTATGLVVFNRSVALHDANGNVTFTTTRDGLVKILSPNAGPTDAVLSINSSVEGTSQLPINRGTMLQVTGVDNMPARFSLDAFGYGSGQNAYINIAARSARGTPTTPTATQANDLLFRLSANGWGNTGYATVPQGIAQINFFAEENFSDSNHGTRIEVRTTAPGSATGRVNTVLDSTGIKLPDSSNGITFSDTTRQTTAWTGTVDVSLVNNLGSAAVTSLTQASGISVSNNVGGVTIGNTGVLSITGTPNQILADHSTGAIKLSLPQNIASTSNVTFNDITINGQLNFAGTGTVLIPNTVEGTVLYLGSSATNISQLDGGGIQLGNSSTNISSMLWNRTYNYWDFDGSGINVQQLYATTSSISTLDVNGSVSVGVQYSTIDYTNAPLQVDGIADAWIQGVIQNHSTTSNASADWVATNDIGGDIAHYIDMGINSSVYSNPNWTVNGANDGYLYIDSGNLAIGTTASNIVFFTNGTLSANIQATITSDGLRVANTVTSAGFYGPVTGNIVGNVTGNVSGNAGSVTNGIYSSSTYANPSFISSLAGSKITGVVAQATTVTNGVYTTDTGTVSNNMLAGNIANNKLSNNQITFNAGTGIGVSVASPSLGGSTTISNTGVTQITTGTGIRVTASTGSVQISFANDSGYALASSVPTNNTQLINGSGFITSSSLSVTTLSSGTEALSYSTATGVFSFTPANLSSYATQSFVTGQGYITTSSLSVTTAASGTNALSYNNGVFTFTPQNLSTYATQSFVTGQGYITTSSVVSVSAGNGITVNTTTGAVIVTLNTATLMAHAVLADAATTVTGGYVSSITAGTGTAVSASSGNITIWNTIPPFVLTTATASLLGGVKVGANITASGDGTISVAAPFVLTTATSSVLGGVKVGSGFTALGDGTLSVVQFNTGTLVAHSVLADTALVAVTATNVINAVTSLTGTTNQITASAATGSVTLSFPTAGVTLPGQTHLSAGTTTTNPLSFASGPIQTTTSAGDVEYDGTAMYFTPSDSQRGVIATEQFYVLNADRTFTPGSGAQTTMFNVGVSVSSTTRYHFAIKSAINRSAGTGSTLRLGFGGTAVLGRVSFFAVSINSGGQTMVNTNITSGFATGSAVTLSGANGTANIIEVFGTIDVTTAGTLIPQIGWGVTPGTVTVPAGSLMRINPISATGANTSVGTWA